MDATNVLMNEHRVIERVLTSLEKAAHRLGSGQAVRAEFFVDAADFIKGFADGCHHEKEEGALFPALTKAGLPEQGGPVGVMLSEHEEGRRLTKAMRAAALDLAAGKQESKPRLIESALAYAALLRMHIAKEDEVLFPMADQLIQGREKDLLTDAFKTFEQSEAGDGLHAKYLALAARLEQEAAS